MKKKSPITEFSSREDRINYELGQMRHKDLQKACVSRGLDFQKIIDWDHHKLSNWFFKNYELGEDATKLTEYDAFIEGKLMERGYKKGDAILAPSFRLGFSPDIGEIKNIQTPGASQPPPRVSAPEDKPKSKRVVDELTGVYSGTKKNLTYTLTDEGIGIEEIITKVIKQFPDAQDKSIKIWNKRRLKELKDEKAN